MSSMIVGGWQSELGPFADLDQVSQALSLPRSEVYDRAGRREILRVHDATGDAAFPLFAFGPAIGARARLSIVPDLGGVLTCLARSTEEEWLWALWLSGLLPKHGAWSAIDLLLAKKTDVVLERARNEDWAWTVKF